MRRKRPSNYYTVWLAEDDTILAHGTSMECRKQLNVTQDSFYCLVSRALSGKSKKYSVLVERIGEE